MVLHDFFSLSEDSIECIISQRDFWDLNSISSIIFVYKENIPSNELSGFNNTIKENLPECIVTINNQLDEKSKDVYMESLSLIFLLLTSCMINYWLIFLYLVKTRTYDYTVMRLFGMTRTYIALSILLEFLIYNIVTWFLSTTGFTIYWIIDSGSDFIIRFVDALPIMGIFLVMSLIIGLCSAIKLCKKSPISYKLI